MARVVVLGSSNTDLCVRLPKLPGRGETVLGGPFWSGPGGKGANQAVAARRAGAEVIFVTAVGDDAFGRESLDRYRAEGIDVSHARRLTGVASGVALIFVGEEGENVIGVAPGANAKLLPEDIDALPESVFDPSSVLLASLEVPLETVGRALSRAKRAGMTTILNPAPVDLRLGAGDEVAGAIDGPARGLLQHVDVLTPNQNEAAALGRCEASHASEFAAASLRQRFGVRHVIVTRGAAGCLLFTEGSSFEFTAHAVQAIDTVGAGDAFNGALATALADRLPLTEAVAWASAAGALAVTRHGAQAALPSRVEIERLAAAAPRFERFTPDDRAAS
ncbi:MAG: ribokinase [Isosphaeraceae bacterium]|nr:ribokinase [Isosphaeraceae bacterium]